MWGVRCCVRVRGLGRAKGLPCPRNSAEQRCIRRQETSEAVGQAVGGGYQRGWGRLLSVTHALEAGTCRQGDSGWALAGRPGAWSVAGGTSSPSNASLVPSHPHFSQKANVRAPKRPKRPHAPVGPGERTPPSSHIGGHKSRPPNTAQRGVRWARTRRARWRSVRAS